MKLATFVSMVAGGGTASPVRNALDGNAGSAFGSLLSRMTEDGSAAATGAAAPAADAVVSGDDSKGNATSQQAAATAAAAEDGPELSEAAAAAAVGTTGATKLAGGAGVTSLLTLATRAAEPARNAAKSSSIASAGAVDPDVTSEAQALGSSSDVSTDAGEHSSGRLGRKSSKTDDSDQAGEISSAPVTVAGQVATTSAFVAATAPSGSDASNSSSTIAGGATLAGAAAIASSAVASDAIASAPLPSETATAIESAIVPGTVAVESHLGFSRGVPGALPGSDAPTADSTLATGSTGGSMVATATAMLVSGADGAIAAATGASPSRPASTQASSKTEGAVSSDASLALEDGGGAADAAAVGTRASSDASSSSVTPVVPSSSKLTGDEQTPLALDVATQVSATSVVAIVAPNAQAATPVLQQVADGVAGLASPAVPDESALAKRVAPARTIALQLSPAGLGTLTIRLHVTGRALDVQLETSDGSTAALIDRDRDALSVALSGKDYQLQSLSVTTHDATVPGANYAERSPDTGSADSGSSGQSPGNNSSGGRAGDRSSREAPRPTQAEDAVVERGGSSLFV